MNRGMFHKVTDEERELLKDVDLMADADALTKLLMTLEADYHADDKWDQPAILYLVVGDPDDPYFVRHGEAHPSPPVFLQDAWDAGLRLKDNVLGLAFAHEGWRHLNYEEAVGLMPDLLEMLTGVAKIQYPDLTDEERTAEMAKAYYKVADERFPMPSQMPPHLRGETRHVSLTMRNGSTLGVMRDRGSEPELMQAVPYELAKVGRVARFIHQMLNDQRPEMHPGEVLNENRKS